MGKSIGLVLFLVTCMSLQANVESLECYLCGIEQDSPDAIITPCPIPFDPSDVETCIFEPESTRIPICVVIQVFSFLNNSIQLMHVLFKTRSIQMRMLL
jgi:hypothetical protein